MADPYDTPGYRYSVNEFPGDGTTINWNIQFAGRSPGYISIDHVRASVTDEDGVETPITLSQSNFIQPTLLRIEPAVAAGSVLRVWRDTPKDEPLLDYNDGALMTERNLDTSFDQAVYAVAEMVDRAADSLEDVAEFSEAVLDRLADVEDTANEAAADAQAAAQSASNSAVDAAQAAADAASYNEAVQEAAADAASAAQAAADANDAAQAVLGVAEEARDIASDAETAANAAVATANNAESVANGIDAKAQEALDTADGADAKAQTALDNSADALQGINDLADDTDPDKGASLVGYKPEFSGAVSRDVFSKIAETVSVRDFGAVGDGGTDDLAAINAAISYCLAESSTLYWPAGTYVATASIPNFHNVEHTGKGVVKRGDNVWFITPVRDSHLNIQYVGPGASSANDGLSPEYPTTPTQALRLNLYHWADKTSRGTWRVQFTEGTYTYNGVRCDNFPFFRNRLQVYGTVDPLTGKPTAIWNGQSVTERNGIRSDNTSTTLAFHIKDIRFTNWQDSAVVLWGGMESKVENCEAYNTGTFAFWYRTGYIRHIGGEIDSCATAIGIQYAGAFNIGQSDAPVVIKNCGRGVSVGRVSAGHVSYTTFEDIGVDCIHVEMNCRVRTVRNHYKSFGSSAIRLNTGSVWNNDIGELDTFEGVGVGKPAIIVDTGSISHPNLSSGRTTHRYVNTFYALPAGSGRTLMNETVGYTAPIRLRGFSLYSESMVAEVEFFFSLQVNQGGLFELAMGPGIGDVMCSVTADQNMGSTVLHGRVKFTVFGPQTGGSICRAFSELSVDGRPVKIGETTFSANNPVFRSPDAQEKLGRLYVTPTNAAVAGPTMKHLRSYMEP